MSSVMMQMQMERKGVHAIMSTLSVLPPSQSLEEDRVQGIWWRWKYNCDLTRAQKYRMNFVHKISHGILYAKSYKKHYMWMIPMRHAS